MTKEQIADWVLRWRRDETMTDQGMYYTIIDKIEELSVNSKCEGIREQTSSVMNILEGLKPEKL